MRVTLLVQFCGYVMTGWAGCVDMYRSLLNQLSQMDLFEYSLSIHTTDPSIVGLLVHMAPVLRLSFKVWAQAMYSIPQDWPSTDAEWTLNQSSKFQLKPWSLFANHAPWTKGQKNSLWQISNLAADIAWIEDLGLYNYTTMRLMFFSHALFIAQWLSLRVSGMWGCYVYSHVWEILLNW